MKHVRCHLALMTAMIVLAMMTAHAGKRRDKLDKKDAKKVLAQFDRDQDNMLSKDEIYRAITTGKNKLDRPWYDFMKGLHKRFEEADKNRDYQLSFEEIWNQSHPQTKE